MHIYETADYWQGGFSNWKEDTNQEKFLKLMKQYKDKIILEVTGHNHLSGLRYHQADNDQEYYLTKVLFPSVTASSNTQPAFSTFEYDTEQQIASKMQFTFLDLQDSIGLPEDTTIDELTWFTVDWEEEFGLEELTGKEFAKLE